MRRTKIVQILSSFDEQEWRACHKYLKYCNKKESNSILLFEYLFKYRRRLESPKLDRKIVLRKVLPDLSEKALLNLLSHVVKDVEAFMVHQEMAKSKRVFDQKKILAEVYKEKGLYSFFERTLKDLNEAIEKGPSLDVFTSLRKLHMHHLNYFSESYGKNARPHESLHLAEKYRNDFAENLKRLYDIEAESTRILLNTDSIKKNDSATSDLIVVLTHLRSLVVEHKLQSAAYLESVIKTSVNEMSENLSEIILLCLLNECSYQIKRGRNIYKDKMASFYVFGLDKHILLNNGKLSEKRFLNIIDVLSKSKNKEVPDTFISKWVPKVETKNPHVLESMAHAMWAFAKEDYHRALRMVEQSDITLINLNISLRARWIKICSLSSIYDEYQEANEILDSAKVFFTRHKKKINIGTFQGSLNLITIIKMIWQGSKKEDVQIFVSQCEYVIQRNWIDQKIRKMAR